MESKLVEKIRSREARITVIGLGHIGLVTAVVFAESGFKVVGVDVNPKIVRIVASGRSHIKEHGLAVLIRKVIKNGNLKVTMNTQLAFKDSDVAIVCVQTPLTKNKKPDLSQIKKVCEELSKSLSKGKVVIIESTVPPRATQEIIARILEDRSKLRCGKDFRLAHCPERISTGHAVQDFTGNARIVGGFDEESTKIAAELYSAATRGEILATDSTTAEVAKLAENSFRDVNIAFANELALICEEIGVDAADAIKLANTHPRVNIHKPGCGVGGPCITKDPYLLLHPVENQNLESRLVLSSRKLNDYMPEHAVTLVITILKKVKKEIENSKIVILGAAYKGEIDDARNSPAEKIVHRLRELGAKTIVYDPYTAESFGAPRARNIWEAAKGADCVVIVTEHEMFKTLELKKLRMLMNENPVIFDGRRVIDPMKAKRLGFRYVGIGYNI